MIKTIKTLNPSFSLPSRHHHKGQPLFTHLRRRFDHHRHAGKPPNDALRQPQTSASFQTPRACWWRCWAHTTAARGCWLVARAAGCLCCEPSNACCWLPLENSASFCNFLVVNLQISQANFGLQKFYNSKINQKRNMAIKNHPSCYRSKEKIQRKIYP